jgi:hypothetical protein
MDEGSNNRLVALAADIEPAQHIEWIMRQGFESPDAWLSDTAYRRRWGKMMPEPSEAFKHDWAAYKLEHAAQSREAIQAELDEAA